MAEFTWFMFSFRRTLCRLDKCLLSIPFRRAVASLLAPSALSFHSPMSVTL